MPIYNETGSGGALSSGGAFEAIGGGARAGGGAFEAIGGAVLGGGAIVFSIVYNPAISGGLVGSGGAFEAIGGGVRPGGGAFGVIGGGARVGGGNFGVIGGGVTASGGQYESVGGGARAGGSATVFGNHTQTVSGGALVGGAANISFGDPTIGGGVVAGGSSVPGATYTHTATGGALAGGFHRITETFGGGGLITISGDVGSPKIILYIDQGIQFHTKAAIDMTLALEWDSGQLPLRWFRVEGCCRFPTPEGDGAAEGGGPKDQLGGCDVIPFEQPSCKGGGGANQKVMSFINIVARNPAEVCEKLREAKWEWTICKMQRFSRPVLNEDVSPSDECNKLEDIPFCDNPECAELCLQTDGIVSMGMAVTATLSPFAYQGSGGIITSGSAGARIIWPHAEGSGTIIMGGEADVRSGRWSYTGDGTIIMGGEAGAILDYYGYTGGGTIIMAGEAGATSRNWFYQGTGGIVTGGDGAYRIKIPFISSGQSDTYPSFAGIVIGGGSDIGVYWVIGSGGITMAGDAVTSIRKWKYIPDGQIITMGGEALIRSPNWHYDPTTGSIVIGGAASYIANKYVYIGDGTIIIGGEASARDSSGGDFWWVGEGGISMAGDGQVTTPKLRYIPDGQIITMGGTGSTDSTWKGEFTVSMGMKGVAEDEEVFFSTDDAPTTLTPPARRIITTCGECNNMPLVLFMNHNMENAAVFREFMLRNGFKLPDPLVLHYSQRADCWQGVIHYTGIAADNDQNKELWRFTFEWSCVDELAGNSLGANVWKFSMLVTRRNLNTGLDFDTRLLIVFPSDAICKGKDQLDFDFPFRLNTRKIYVRTDLNILVDVILLFDNIGLFKSKFWIQNPDLRIRISEIKKLDEIERQDISPIIPKQPLLVPVT